MAANLRKNVNHLLADYVYPSVSNDVQRQYLVKPGHEYISSLPLQMILYFNIFYFPFWLVIEVVMLAEKFSELSILYKIVVIAILVFMTIIEAMRLFTGYVGNLTEKAPEMSAFWLLTFFLQLPLILFLLLNEATVITPIERSVTILMTIFIILEIIIGFFAMRHLFKYEATKFHLQQFTNLEQIDNPYEERDCSFVNPAFENRFDQ